MSRGSDCHANALTERVFAIRKAELVDTRPWPTRLAARKAISERLEVCHNRRRSHSALGFHSPVAYELALAREAQAA